ncbi:hypothetical protein MCUN1_001958 [Malassezia cuniculi]|uniref:Uncharacterized protein n=1 Tax=Malassezia cuniculi TaxID=948313 RepID=A0AAF0EU04_9BASI|nr:hypothetical protein MCUN1_001958 [Malassezia cuniculi]
MNDYPNPYADPVPNTHQPPEDETSNAEDELERAIRESVLQQKREAEEREKRERAELEEAMRVSQRESTLMQLGGDEDEQLRQVLEQSRREAYADERRREAERQRHALLELDIIEQSRLEHERRMRSSVSYQSPPNTVSTDQESLLWLDSPHQSNIGAEQYASSSRQPHTASHTTATEDLAFLADDPAFQAPAQPPQPSQPATTLQRERSWPNPFGGQAQNSHRQSTATPAALQPHGTPETTQQSVSSHQHNASVTPARSPRIDAPRVQPPRDVPSPQPHIPRPPSAQNGAYDFPLDETLFMPSFPATPIARPHSSNAQQRHATQQEQDHVPRPHSSNTERTGVEEQYMRSPQPDYPSTAVQSRL